MAQQKEETKNATIRIPVAMFEELTKDGDSLNGALIKIWKQKKRAEGIMALDVKGIFTSDEWKALAASMNGTMIDEYTRYSSDMLCAHNEDSELYEGSFTQFGVDVKALNEKIKGMTCLQISAIYARISEFWNNNNGCGEMLNKWAEW